MEKENRSKTFELRDIADILLLKLSSAATIRFLWFFDPFFLPRFFGSGGSAGGCAGSKASFDWDRSFCSGMLEFESELIKITSVFLASLMEQFELSEKSSSRAWPLRVGRFASATGESFRGRLRFFSDLRSGLSERSGGWDDLIWPFASGRMKTRHFFTSSFARFASDSFVVRRLSSLMCLPNRVVCAGKNAFVNYFK